MKLMEKILVPVDFSKGSERAIEGAVETAKIFQSELYLIHVIPELKAEDIPMDMIRKKISGKLEETATGIEKSGVSVRGVFLEEGSVIDKILSTASFYDVNVIVTGAGSQEKGLGTVSGKLVRKSSKPVWIVKGNGAFNDLEILATVDFSSASARALKNAVHLARNFESRLHVITVAKSISSLFSGFFSASEEKERAYEQAVKEKFGAFLSGFDFTGVEYKTTVLQGKPHEEILGYISENNIGLTVIGSVGDTKDSYTMIGSVAEKVVRDIPTSFITVKSEDPIVLKMEAELKDIEVCTIQGNELLENGMPDAALNHYRHCLTIDPLYVKAWDNMAVAFRRMGDETRASEAENRSKEIEERLWSKRVEAEIKAGKFRS